MLVRRKFRELRALNTCCVPGCLEPVQFCHKAETELKGMGRGRKERFYDIVKHPEAYLPFCKTHHRQYDKGQIHVSGAVIFGWLVPVENEGRALELYLAREISLPELIEARL